MGMSAPRWTKIRRDLAAHKVRTLLVVLSIAVGIFAAAVMLGGRAVLMRTLDESFPASNPASVTFFTSAFDDLLVREVERQPDVVAAQGRHRSDLSYRRPGREWQNMTVYAAKDFDAIRIGRLQKDPGTPWPKRGEILIERASKDFTGLAVGDEIEFDVTGERKPLFRVVGYVYDLNSTVPIMTGSAVGYVSPDSLAELDQFEKPNQLDVVARRSLTEADLSRLAAKLRDDVLVPRGVLVGRTQVHQPNTHYIADIFKAVTLLLVAVGVLTLFLSGFLVVNTVSSLVTQQTRQIGVMKAVGARPRQLVTMYFLMVAAYGAAALLLALPVASVASRAFIDFGGSKLNFLVRDYTMPTDITLMELGVGLLVPLAAASVPVLAGMRMPVRQALYPQGIKATEFGEGLFDRLLGRIQGLSRPTALALRNTFVRKGRLALTLVTLSLAAAVFVAVASVRSSIDVTVGRIGLHRAYDLWVNLGKERPAAELEREALRVRGVSSVESWITRNAIRVRPDRTESPSMVLYGIPAKTGFFRPEVTSGRWLRPEDKNAVVVDSGLVKEEPDVGVGSTIELKIGEVDDYFRVVGVVRGDFLQPFVYAERGQLDKLINAKGGAKTLVVRSDGHELADQEAVARRLSDRLAERGISVSQTETQKALQKMIADSLNIVVVFLVIMAGLLVAVGGIGLSGTMSINVMESTREIGVMRAIGAANRSIYQVFITEGVVVGVISWAIGGLLAVPMSLLLTRALERAMGFPLTFGFSFEGVAAWLAFVIVISVVASLLPAYRAARVSVAEAIAYE